MSTENKIIDGKTTGNQNPTKPVSTVIGIGATMPPVDPAKDANKDYKDESKMQDPDTPKKKRETYRVLSSGTVQASYLSSAVERGTNYPIKKFFSFKDTRLPKEYAEVPEVIATIEKARAEDANKPMKLRRYLTQEEYEDLVSPSSTSVEYAGKSYNIKAIREALDFATDNGFKLKDNETVIVKNKQGSVGRGVQSTGTSRI